MKELGVNKGDLRLGFIRVVAALHDNRGLNDCQFYVGVFYSGYMV